MTTERTKWWKAFLPKRKSGGPKEPSSPTVLDPDFDPFAERPDKAKAPKPSGEQRDQSNNNSSIHSDDTYDDSNLESVFNEQTCRRNMKVSRSGRFKEKRRVRSTLPIEDKETENGPPGKEDKR